MCSWVERERACKGQEQLPNRNMSASSNFLATATSWRCMRWRATSQRLYRQKAAFEPFHLPLSSLLKLNLPSTWNLPPLPAEALGIGLHKRQSTVTQQALSISEAHLTQRWLNPSYNRQPTAPKCSQRFRRAKEFLFVTPEKNLLGKKRETNRLTPGTSTLSPYSESWPLHYFPGCVWRCQSIMKHEVQRLEVLSRHCGFELPLPSFTQLVPASFWQISTMPCKCGGHPVKAFPAASIR